jgi:hypothetical protein
MENSLNDWIFMRRELLAKVLNLLIVVCIGGIAAAQEPAAAPLARTTRMQPLPEAAGVIPDGLIGESPFAQYSGYGEGYGCGPGGGYEYIAPGYWANFDMLMWWRSGQNLPPLVTTEPNQGILPDGQILYGNEIVGSRMHVGFRVDAGMWFAHIPDWGAGFRFAMPGRDLSVFNLTSDGTTQISRPFFDAIPNNLNRFGNNAFEVAGPNANVNGGASGGSINVTTTSEIYIGDIFFRRATYRGDFLSVDATFGYQSTRINESLIIDSTTLLPNSLRVLDYFQTYNEFHGGTIGMLANIDRGVWQIDVMSKLAFGRMRERVRIRSLRDPEATPPADPQAGLLALGSNRGTFDQYDFAVVPEVSLKLGYYVTPNLRLSVGYSLVYGSTVVQPGNQVDTVINSSQIDGALNGEARPRFLFHTSDYWVQGVNLGLTFDY